MHAVIRLKDGGYQFDVLTLAEVEAVRKRSRAGQAGPWVTDFANSIAGPAVEGESVVITAGYNHNCMVRVAISMDGAKEVWRKRHPSKVCTPVIHEGSIYVAWNRVKCIDFKTGESVYKQLTGTGIGYNNWQGSLFLHPDGGTAVSTTIFGLMMMRDTHSEA